MGWKSSGGHYESFQIQRPEYSQLAHCEVTNDWQCDITDVLGFSMSKSDLTAFPNMDAMVETNSREMINEITPAKLARNLAHREIRIIHSPGTTDHFARHLWDGRLFLMNDGGSHHFAAARYIAARLGTPVPLRGKLRTYALNPLAIASLRRDFEMYAIADTAELCNGFHDAMRAYKATWLSHPLPAPLDNVKAILLPKSEPRSMRASATLDAAGAFNLGQHLAALCVRQHEISSRQPSY